MKLAVFSSLLLLAAPSLARAEPASIVSRDLPLAGGRELAQATPRFTLVGLHWQGPGAVSFRTRSLAGRWSGWHPAAPEDEDRPDAASRERSRPGWRLGNPYWTGPSDRIEYRVRGTVRRLRAHLVWSAAGPGPARAVAEAASPAVVPRLSWGANELIRRAAPLYAASVQFAVVHHTAGSNSYTRAESAAVVRAIQLYHVRGNGWNDIGYNFLVDKYGQVFEGRFGGVERNVVGAHAEGFNTGSVGVAVLGNYGGVSLSAAARAALVNVLAWRLDVAHVDPLATVSWLSGGNSRFPSGTPVPLRTVSGHRDTGFTSCPGNRIYGVLADVAQVVSLTGLPKLYGPTVRGGPGGTVRFTGRLSAPASWTVTVVDALGKTVATGGGTGDSVDWTWDATAVPSGSYSWTMSGGEGVRPATGTLGARAVTLAVTNAAARPSSVTPNGDGRDDSTVISYTLTAPATVTATLVDPAGSQLATLFSEGRPAGQQSFAFTAESVPDGVYRIVLTAVGANGRQATASVSLLVNRTLSAFAAARAAFSPNGDGKLDRLAFTFALASPAQVKLRILRAGRWVATVFSGPLAPGAQRLEWDGRKRYGRLLDGVYEAELQATDVVGMVSQRVTFGSDTKRPELRLVRIRPLRFRVSERAEVVVVAGGRRHVVKAPAAGVYAVPGEADPSAVRAVAWDAAGNRSLPARYP